MLRLSSRAVLFTAAALAGLPASAAPTVYFGEDLGAASAANLTNSSAARAAFVGQLTGVATENFEGFTGGQLFPGAGLVFAGSPVTATISGGTIRDVPFNARFAVDGTNYLDSSFNRRITFLSPVAAFGLFVIDANENNNNPATVTVNGQLLTPADIDARPFDSVDGIFRIVTERSAGVFETLFNGGTFPATDSSGMFVGLIDAANPFSNIVLINGTSGLDVAFQDGFGYDLLTTGTPVAAIPEPETYALLLAGLAAVGAAARRRKEKGCPR